MCIALHFLFLFCFLFSTKVLGTIRLVKDKVDATLVYPNCMQFFYIPTYIATFCFYFTLSVEVFRKYKSFERQIWCNFGLSQLYKCIKSVFSKENQCNGCCEKTGSSKGKSFFLDFLPFFESNYWISLNRLLWSSKVQTSFPLQLREY